MRIIMLSTDKKIFSAGSRVRKRQLAYGELCDELHIIIPADSSQPAVQKIGDNVWLYATQTTNKLVGWWRLMKLAVGLKKKRDLQAGDSLITTQDAFEVGLAGWLAAKSTGLPLNLQVHVDISSRYFRQESVRRRFQSWVARRIIPRAETVRVVSTRVAAYVSRFRAGGVHILPIYTDKQQVVRQAAESSPDLPFAKTLAIVARLEPAKGVGFAIEALAPILRDRKDTGLAVLGDGSMKAGLKKQVQKEKITDKVEFLGWADNPLPYMKQAYLTVVPSYYEGWGMTAVESLLVGTPVIMTDVGCGRDLVTDETGGVIVPVDDKEALQESTEDFLADESRRVTYSQRASRVEKKINSQEEYLKQLKDIWKATIKNS